MIQVVVGDLAFQTTNAIVRPATALLEPTSSALQNVERIAGPALSDLAPVQELDVGAATVTSAGDLDAEFVIHAIIRSATEPISATGVRRALQSSLERASGWEFASLALPPIGVGPGNLALEAAADIMADVIPDYVKERSFPADVLIVVGSDDERAVFDGRLSFNS